MAASVFDVAAHMLDGLGCTPSMKLHRLLYCAQAVCLVDTGRCIFESPIEAWEVGPVVVELHHVHEGALMLFAGDFDDRRSRRALASGDAVFADLVLDRLGDWSSERLRRLVCSCLPWISSRTLPWTRVIEVESMALGHGGPSDPLMGALGGSGVFPKVREVAGVSLVESGKTDDGPSL